MPFPSPDSSTHQKISSEPSEDSIETFLNTTKISKSKQEDDIQNHAINSTQDMEVQHRKRSISLRSKLKSKLKRLKLTTYDPVLELAGIEKEFLSWSEKHMVPSRTSLIEGCTDREVLGKNIFSLINKKEFKQLMPDNLKCYNARDVRNWCLQELGLLSDQRLSAILDGNCNDGVENSQEKEVASTSVEAKNKDSPKEESNLINISKSNSPLVKDEEGSDIGSANENDHEIFQDIVKTPDQCEIDELLNTEAGIKTGRVKDNMDDKESSDGTITGGDNLNMLELELRARALKSFIKLQETKRSNTSQ